MKVRTIKRRLYAKIRQAGKEPFKLTAEDLEWLHMPPVDAEFDSPDYERLTREAMADVDQGRVVDHEHVKRWADQLR